MRVMKINEEIDSSQLDAYKSALNTSSNDELVWLDDEHKTPGVLTSIFIDLGLGDNAQQAAALVEKMNPSFVKEWINAIKLEELTDPTNEFIVLLNDNRTKDILLDNFNVRNFSKVYNAYTDGVLENDALNYKTYIQLLHHPDTYRFDDKEFREVFRIFDDLRSSNKFDDDDLRRVFFHLDGNKLRVNSLDAIRMNAGRSNNRRRNNTNLNDSLKSTIDDIMQNRDAVEYIRNLLN